MNIKMQKIIYVLFTSLVLLFCVFSPIVACFMLERRDYERYRSNLGVIEIGENIYHFRCNDIDFPELLSEWRKNNHTKEIIGIGIVSTYRHSNNITNIPTGYYVTTRDITETISLNSPEFSPKQQALTKREPANDYYSIEAKIKEANRFIQYKLPSDQNKKYG